MVRLDMLNAALPLLVDPGPNTPDGKRYRRDGSQPQNAADRESEAVTHPLIVAGGEGSWPIAVAPSRPAGLDWPAT